MRWLWVSLLCCLPVMADAAEPIRIAGLVMPEPLQMEAPAQAPKDRWGRPIHQDEALALSLLADGRAQLQPEDGTKIPATWWAAEHAAQQKKFGLWGQACCRVLPAGGAAPDLPLNTWRIVEGTVTAIKVTKAATYINFSPNPQTAWQTDFSLKLAPRLARTLNVTAWEGKTLQARGYISWYYGPSIEVIVPDQVQIQGQGAEPQTSGSDPQR